MSFFQSTSYNTAAINTDVYVNLAAAENRKVIKQIIWSLSAEPASAAALTIESPVGTVLASIDITKGGPGFMPFDQKGLPCADKQAVQILLDLPASANTTGKLTVVYDID